ncbi:hypothetical protein KY285_011019 [Solanum tuberosum]|nr:hypothetical protein KY285_011019 [Solanum tuberosum]
MDGWIGPILLGELRGMIPQLQGRSFAENGTEIAEFQILSRLEWGKTQSTILGMVVGWELGWIVGIAETKKVGCCTVGHWCCNVWDLLELWMKQRMGLGCGEFPIGLER